MRKFILTYDASDGKAKDQIGQICFKYKDKEKAIEALNDAIIKKLEEMDEQEAKIEANQKEIDSLQDSIPRTPHKDRQEIYNKMHEKARRMPRVKRDFPFAGQTFNISMFYEFKDETDGAFLAPSVLQLHEWFDEKVKVKVKFDPED